MMTISRETKELRREEHTILVVDDDPDMLSTLVSYLTRESYAVLSASSARQACELIRVHPLSLVLLDWDLRGGKRHPSEPDDGGAVIEVCRPLNPTLPIVVFSGLRDVDVRTDALMAQASSFLQKPISAQVLLRHIEGLIKLIRPSACFSTPNRVEDILPMREMKRQYVQGVLQLLDNNTSLAAKKLSLNRHTVSAMVTKSKGAEA